MLLLLPLFSLLSLVGNNAVLASLTTLQQQQGASLAAAVTSIDSTPLPRALSVKSDLKQQQQQPNAPGSAALLSRAASARAITAAKVRFSAASDPKDAMVDAKFYPRPNYSALTKEEMVTARRQARHLLKRLDVTSLEQYMPAAGQRTPIADQSTLTRFKIMTAINNHNLPPKCYDIVNSYLDYTEAQRTADSPARPAMELYLMLVLLYKHLVIKDGFGYAENFQRALCAMQIVDYALPRYRQLLESADLGTSATGAPRFPQLEAYLEAVPAKKRQDLVLFDVFLKELHNLPYLQADKQLSHVTAMQQYFHTVLVATENAVRARHPSLISVELVEDRLRQEALQQRPAKAPPAPAPVTQQATPAFQTSWPVSQKSVRRMLNAAGSKAKAMFGKRQRAIPETQQSLLGH